MKDATRSAAVCAVKRLGRWDAFGGRWVGAGPFGGNVEVLEWPDLAEVSFGGDRCPELIEVGGPGVGDQDQVN
jgi:hypothetical protein